MVTKNAHGLKFFSSHSLHGKELKASRGSKAGSAVWRIFNRLVAFLTVSFLLIGAVRADQLVPSGSDGGNIRNLSLVGFNYTNRIIESYTVDYASGGDIRLSSLSSGGGGVACCFAYSLDSIDKMLVNVRWQADGCLYLLKSPITNATASIRHLRYQEKLVKVEKRTTGTPEFLEIHIFQDGSVKVFLTSELSAPLLRLNGDRADKSSFPRCKNDKKPQ